MCVNVDDCGTGLILFQCVTTGATCCGSACYDVMKFNVTGQNTLTTPNKPGMCATGEGGQVTLAACPKPGATIPDEMVCTTQSLFVVAIPCLLDPMHN